MKNIFLMISLALMTSLAAINVHAANEKEVKLEKGDLFVASTGLNLRKAPGTSSPIIRRAEPHEVVMVENTQPSQGFVQVRLKDGSPAWVALKYLKRINDQ